MSELVQKIIVGIVAAVLSATISGVSVYVGRASRFEPRLDAIEKTLIRIETRLYPSQELPPRQDRQ